MRIVKYMVVVLIVSLLLSKCRQIATGQYKTGEQEYSTPGSFLETNPILYKTF